ncbi:MAG: Spy/CpxP family protein refolding chaperone [Gemmatimonadota bacterium]
MNRWLRVLILAVVVCATAAPVEAQNRGNRRGGPQDREELMERIRARMATMMQERLGLTEAESERLSEIVQGFETQRRELARAEMAARRRVEAVESDDDITDAEAEQLIAQLVQLRRDEVLLFEAELEALHEVLTPVQVLEFQALREQMGRRIRSLRGGDRDRGRTPEDGRSRRRGRGGGH